MQSRFLGAVSVFDDVQALLPANPEKARTTTDMLVAQQVVKLAQARDLSLHLLADTGGATFGVHGVNVSVLSLLLGKTLGLCDDVLKDLGTAALLHDIGKPGLEISASANALNQGTGRTPLRETVYARHVGESVALALSMGYPPSVTTAIAQHHEWADGSGFPLGLLAEDMDIAGQILALVNNFERLCNLPLQGNEMTPHEAMAALYGQYRQRYAPDVLKAFVQTLGVYPPGSLVELSDGRMGVVVSVNTSQSLKPKVLTYDTQAPQKLRFVDLLEYVGLGIRRGLTRNQLSRNALEALQPQRRLCYFFDSSAAPAAEKDLA
ncbi:HD-GYP domain-containing protein [Comamonas sp. HJ-2]